MRSPPDRWTAEEATEFALLTLAFARERRAETRSDFLAMGVLLVDGAILPVGGLHVLEGKDRGPALRRLAQEQGARFVVHVYEAWCAKVVGDEERAAFDAHRAAGGQVRDFDGREEVLLCSVDGPGLNRLWSCPILPDGTAGEPRDACPPGTRWSGNVANLAGRQGEN